ncbi:MAG: hypothetical protein M3N82_12585 [Pseudomonadota bacterium]|nr:hypothetical protein [Pseudomonadota bacterium]
MPMIHKLNKHMRRGAAIVAMTACTAAFAGPTSEWRYIGDFQAAASTKGLATGRFESASGLGTRFDSSAWNGGSSVAAAGGNPALTLDAQTVAASADASAASSNENRRALSASTIAGTSSPVTGSPAAVDLTLWNFIANIRAQQVSNPFVQLRTNAENIDITLNDLPPPVPIPPAFWLFGVGLAVLPAARWLARGKSLLASSRPLAAA